MNTTSFVGESEINVSCEVGYKGSTGPNVTMKFSDGRSVPGQSSQSTTDLIKIEATFPAVSRYNGLSIRCDVGYSSPPTEIADNEPTIVSSDYVPDYTDSCGTLPLNIICKCFNLIFS